MSSAQVSSAEPVPGYDGLKTRQVVASLKACSQADLTKIEGYERAHEARQEILDKLRWMRMEEPMKGYDALDVDGVIKALDKADPKVLKAVRGYERKFANRRDVLEEVERLHRERRVPLVARDNG